MQKLINYYKINNIKDYQLLLDNFKLTRLII